jgi:hypothetical protein
MIRRMMLAAALLGAAALGPGCAHRGGPEAPLGQIRHVVLFGFKPGTPPETLAAIEAGLRRLPQEIDLIRAFEWGTDITENARAQGHTHCMLTVFDTPEDVEASRVHPAHQAFVALAMPHVAQLLVIDYVVGD